jgi:hypothetical protein
MKPILFSERCRSTRGRGIDYACAGALTQSQDGTVYLIRSQNFAQTFSSIRKTVLDVFEAANKDAG